MSFTHSTCSNSNIIHEVDEPKILMRCTGGLNESSYILHGTCINVNTCTRGQD